MEETILTKIKSEHRVLLDNLKKIASCQNLQDKEKLYHQVKKDLVLHLSSEDLSIYKHFREDIPTSRAKEIAEINNREQHLMKDYLQRLNLLKITSRDWPKNFQELISIIERHCQISEDLMFNEAKEDFSKEELVEIGTEYEQSKNDYQNYFLR